MSAQTKGHDMSRYWRLVNNEGGLVTGTWWVTRPDDKGKQHVTPVDVTIWDEARRGGVILKSDDFTAFVKDGQVEPIRVRARHIHVTAEANERLPEIEAAVLAVLAAVEWDEVPA